MAKKRKKAAAGRKGYQAAVEKHGVHVWQLREQDKLNAPRQLESLRQEHAALRQEHAALRAKVQHLEELMAVGAAQAAEADAQAEAAAAMERAGDIISERDAEVEALQQLFLQQSDLLKEGHRQSAAREEEREAAGRGCRAGSCGSASRRR